LRSIKLNRIEIISKLTLLVFLKRTSITLQEEINVN